MREESGVGPVERGPHDEVVERTPGEREAHEPDLHEQHAPVPRRPQVAHVRQPHDREVRACGEHERDQHGREPREARERGPSQLGRPYQTRRHRREPADPERRGADVHPVGDLRLPRRAGIERRRGPTREPAGKTARARTQARAARRGRAATTGRCSASTSAKPSVIDDERVAEARRRHRREVAVEEVARTAAAARPPREARTRRCPRAGSRARRARRDGDAGARARAARRSPRRQISRKPSAPIANASPRNHSQRTRCSVVVGPPAP